MPKQRYSNYDGQPEFSNNQRRLGNRLYCADGDMFLRKYIDNKPVTVAYLDSKHGSTTTIYKNDSSYLWSLEMCNSEFKNPIGHYTVIYYLQPSYPVPMYYVIANNDIAKNELNSFSTSITTQEHIIDGIWLSEKQYSQLEHHILGLTWNKYEYRMSGGEMVRPAFTLDQLSSEIAIYSLPQIR